MNPAAGHLVRGKRIAVIGGGPGGAAFALSLLKLSAELGVQPMPSVQVFERDRNAEERSDRGYSLSVRSDSGGLQVIQRVGALDALAQYNEPGPNMHLSRHNFRPLWTLKEAPVPGLPTPRMRVTRARLRQVLLDHLEPGVLCFGRSIVKAEPLPDGQVRLVFEDGSSDSFDLVVAADGANSRMRALLRPQHQLRYTGYCQVIGKTPPLSTLPKELTMGQWFMMGPHGVGCFLAVMNQAQAIWSLSFAAPQTRAAELQAILNQPGGAQEYLKTEVPRLADGFTEPLPSLIRATDPSTLWALNANDLMPFPNDLPGVVFIGDAWHSMSPFSGNGANVAMRDGWELAEDLLSARHASLADAQAAFSARAAPRAVEAIKDSHRNIGMGHTQGWRQLLSAGMIWIIARIADAVMWLKGTGTMDTSALMVWWRGTQDSLRFDTKGD